MPEDRVPKGGSTVTRRSFLNAASALLGTLLAGAGCDSGKREPSGPTSAPPASAPAPVPSPTPPPPSTPAPPPPDPSPTPSPSPSGTFPLRRPPAGQRYLQTNAGAPFFLLGDTAWSLEVSASQSDVVRYLDNRKAKGFNAFTFEAIEAVFAGGNGNVAPNNWYGEAPFTNSNDFTTPRDAYWANIDYIIQQAAARDMLCIIFMAYEGYGNGNQGWYQQMAAQGAAKLQGYGAWLGNRWLSYDNIMWVAGGDNNPTDRTLSRAIVNGIKSVSNKWLFAWHGARNTNALTFWAGDVAWLDLNTIYDSSDQAAANAEASYNNAVIKPFARIEDTYENPVVGGVSPAFIRWLAWDSALQGGSGAIYGDVAVWRFNGPGVVADPTAWDAAMERPAASSMKYLRQLYESKSWTELVPDYTAHSWMTSGWSTTTFATLAGDGSFGIAYAQNSGSSMTFNMGKLSGPNVLVRWYDPTSGAFVTAGTFPASGSRSFVRSGTNGEGSTDWALLFESAP
jgi:Protein of unknown function (DUF4038)/Putative collagen-binding domain of a collagenase